MGGFLLRKVGAALVVLVLASMLVAFTITPWAAYRLLRGPALRGV